MRARKIIVSLALLVSTQAMAEPFVLSCEMGAEVGKKQDVTFYIDEEGKTVNANSAVFTATSISFDSNLSSGIVTTRINRITGSMVLMLGGEVMTSGQCVVVTKRKF